MPVWGCGEWDGDMLGLLFDLPTIDCRYKFNGKRGPKYGRQCPANPSGSNGSTWSKCCNDVPVRCALVLDDDHTTLRGAHDARSLLLVAT